MLQVIAGLNDPADTAIGGRFKAVNRDALEAMRQADRDAWATIEHRLGRLRAEEAAMTICDEEAED
jgi:hypothetical protein